MAEFFISAIAERVFSKVTSLTFEEVSWAIGVKNDVEKLADTLRTIKAVLQDAEERQGESHNHKLRVWLEKLKDVFYDAEDVLDEFEFQVIRRQVVNRGSFIKKVRDFFSRSNPLAFSFSTGHKIKEIRLRLNEIAADKVMFDLTGRNDNQRVVIMDRETHSFVIASEVMGRDMDKDKIINILMQQSEVENASVIPIVGIGGVGKTALAKLVYNDQRVDEHFDLKMWVCVSDDFELKQLILKIVISTTKVDYNNLGIEQLQSKMQEHLRGRKYLLILDDVWSEDRKRWIELKNLLMGGADGSKIIVTTRSRRVASIMGTVSTFKLAVLPDDVCLSLFIKCEFRAGEEHQHPNLMKMGEEIVKKCGGIPLAVRTLGSLLYSSTDESYWKHVRDNEIWKLEQKETDILPALKLSYDQLPSHLKQCFAYCSVFPKDYDFSHLYLIMFWRAHGLLQSANGNEEPETVGMQYLKELMSRSFFQDFEVGVNWSIFKMHDLIHDLAVQMANGECVIVNSGTGRQLASRKGRHLSFVGCNTNEEDIANFLSKSDRVRTIVLFSVGGVGPKQQFVESCISRFRFLRMLVISNSTIEVLPKRIGNMKHLRYLALSRCRKIKKLPNSICKLLSLQTLMLDGCVELEEFPRDIRYLIGIQTFALTTKQKCLKEKEIGCFNSLTVFIISDCSNLEYLFEDIGRLEVLRTFAIFDCPNLTSLPRGIKYLSSLVNLIISDCDTIDLDFGMQSDNHDHEISGGISPHIQTLWNGGLPKLVQVPQWLLLASANTLQELMIVNCPNFIALPDPQQYLKSLKILRISRCPKLTCLPEDMHLLTALRKLEIEECPALSERCKQGTGEDWPKIEHIPQIEVDGEIIKSPN